MFLHMFLAIRCVMGRLALVIAALVAILGPVCSEAVAQDAGQDAGMEACFAFERAACDKVLSTQPDNLTALFMRGLASELAGDEAAALQDFDATAMREPRHFGAQLWRFVTAASLGQSRQAELTAYLATAQQLGDWPRALADIYLGQATPAETLALAGQQPAPARAEAVCAAEYHIGRAAELAGHADEARAHFQAALATRAAHVFEYQAAQRAINGVQ